MSLRSKTARDRRQDLMEAALRLFIEQGIDHTPVEQICAAAGVAKGTYYLYFQSKNSILAALRERFIENIHQNFLKKRELLQPEEYQNHLALWLDCWIRGYLDNVAAHNIVFQGHSLKEPDPVREDYIIRPLADVLRQGTEAQVWDVENAVLTAIFFFHGVHGILDTLGREPCAVDIDRLTTTIRNLCFRLLGGTPDLFAEGNKGCVNIKQ